MGPQHGKEEEWSHWDGQVQRPLCLPSNPDLPDYAWRSRILSLVERNLNKWGASHRTKSMSLTYEDDVRRLR